MTITRRVSVNLSLTNLLDRSYRIHGSGVDAPGRGGFVSVNVSYQVPREFAVSDIATTSTRSTIARAATVTSARKS